MWTDDRKRSSVLRLRTVPYEYCGPLCAVGLLRLNRVVFALILLFAASAGTQLPRPTASKALGACSAVTSTDLENALGRRFGRGQEDTHGNESTCDYGAGKGLVSITIQRLDTKLDLPLEIESLEKNIEHSSVRMAEGLGDTAFFLDIAGAGTQLHVIRGDRNYVMVSILGFGEAPQVSIAAENLARAALARL